MSEAQYNEMTDARNKLLNPALFHYYKKPLLVRQGHMQWLYDHQGRRYLDMFGGIVTVSVGHCHPHVTEALHRQSARLWHATNIYMYEQIQKFAAQLTKKLPPGLDCVYFVNSGSEANDLAMLMARLYNANAGEVVSLQNGYHGMSAHLIGVTQLSTWKWPGSAQFGPRAIGIPCPDPYRGQFGGELCRVGDDNEQNPRGTRISGRKCPPECRLAKSEAGGGCWAVDQYVRQLSDALLYCVPKHKGVSAFIAESIQGVGGSVEYPRGFLRKAFELVRERHGGLCISDEVQTGFGRTGTAYWGFENHGVLPDIVVMAKGIGNGFPLAAVVTRREIAERALCGEESGALHFNTFGGNPLACAVGSAVLQVIDRDRLQENCDRLGSILVDGLTRLQQRYPQWIGDVRGRGLMLGVEMIEQQDIEKAGEQVNSNSGLVPLRPERVSHMWEMMRECGVLIGKGGIHGNVFRIKPPMCIDQADCEFFLQAFDYCLEKLV